MAQAGKSTKNEDVGQLKEQVDSLREQLAVLTQAVSITSGIESIGRGLADLTEQFQPLRHLVPPVVGKAPSVAVMRALCGLRAALQAPSWADVVTLNVETWDVGYIGQANPPRGKVRYPRDVPGCRFEEPGSKRAQEERKP